MLTDQSLRKRSTVIDEPVERIIIGIAGGSAAGKTTLCENINRQMAFDRNFKVQIISLDAFYKSIDKKVIDVTQYNFDHPNALDFQKAYETLRAMKDGKQKVQIPQYSFTEHRRLQTTTTLSPANVIFFEGLMAFYDKRIRDLMTYKIFIHCDDDIRLCRRLKRDTTQRGRTVISVLHQYNKFVKKSFKDFIYPTIIYADLIIPGFRNNRVSVDFIVQHIKNIARHITFKEKVRKTKIYCFGENEFYDLQYHDSTYDNQITIQQTSFLVFPTSQEHKRQLQFFMSSLLSESFSYEYYQQIYLYQFIKILKSLFKQLIALKNYSLQNIELLSIYQISDVLEMPPNGKHIKAIFIPSAIYPESKSLLKIFKDYSKKYPKTEFILLNIFGDIDFPSAVYQLQMPATILINLYAITNEKRFRQIMIGNTQFIDQSFNWLIGNRQLTDLVLSNISQSLKIGRALTTQFKINRYNFALGSIKIQQHTIPSTIQVGSTKQIQCYQQQNKNLSGYHALSAIITPFQKLTDKNLFIENYYKFKQLLIPIYGLKDYLKISDYQKLQYKDMLTIIKPLNMDTYHDLFLNKAISHLHYSESQQYVVNSQKDLNELYSNLNLLKSKKITELFIIVTVFDHYFLVVLKNQMIYYIDSLSNNLQDIMKIDIDNRKQQSTKTKMRKGIKKILLIIEDTFVRNRNITTAIAEMKIQQIIGSFNQIEHSDEKVVRNWFKSQHNHVKIMEDLIDILKKGLVKGISQKHQKIFNDWISHNHVKSVLGQINVSFDQ